MTGLRIIKVVDAMEGRLWAVLPATIGITFLMNDSSSELFIHAWMIFWAMIMAGHDIDCRRIPNVLTAMTAICAIFIASFHGFYDIVEAFLSGSLVFILMAFLFFMGIVGGGDAKAVSALAMFIPLNECFAFLICISLAGGIQSLLQLFINSRFSDLILLRASIKNWRAVGAGLTLPYGVAILGGCFLWSLWRL